MTATSHSGRKDPGSTAGRTDGVLNALSRSAHGLRLCTVMLALCLLTGCNALSSMSVLRNGIEADFDAARIERYADDQDKVLRSLVRLAGVQAPAQGSADWDLVIASGMDYADGLCNNYLGALFRLDQDRKTATKELGLIGTAAAGIMAAAKAAANEIAITSIAFGLTAATVDTLSGNFLYELDPSSVWTLVRSLQVSYRSRLGSGYVSRPGAVNAIRGYLNLCLPANIQSEVNLAVKQARPGEASPAHPERNQAPVITNAVPIAVTSETSMDDDGNSETLHDFLYPEGVLNRTHADRLRAHLASQGINQSLNRFINGPGNTTARAAAVKALNLR